MSNLRNENVTKCFTLLREFVENAERGNDNKEFAILAIEHLRRITAGEDTIGGSGSIDCNMFPISWPNIH